MKPKQIILAITVLILGVMLWNAFNQKGMNDLETQFEQITFYRNENNTGPVKRVYIVTINDTVWSELEAYGNFQPHNKLGTTEVFFFLEESPFPTKVSGTKPYFSESFNDDVVARYEKNPSGLVSLKKYPFRH